MGRASPQRLPDAAILTQYGEGNPVGPGFRDRLRPEVGETELSLILGEVDATAASMLVVKIVTPCACARSTTVGHLRSQGFQVLHSPTKGNPLHVSVFPPELSTGEPSDWGPELADRFNECFTDFRKGGDYVA